MNEIRAVNVCIGASRAMIKTVETGKIPDLDHLSNGVTKEKKLDEVRRAIQQCCRIVGAGEIDA